MSLLLDMDYTEQLIKVVRNKAAIYDTTQKKTTDRNSQKRQWYEVAEAVIPMWNKLSCADKFIKAKQVQMKWRNLRTSFKREFNLQRKCELEPNPLRRRKYIYYDQLSFLLPTIKDRDGPKSINCNDLEIKDEGDYDCNDQSGDQSDNRSDNNDESFYADDDSGSYEKPQDMETMTPSYEEVVINEAKADEFDEDKLFLLSLVPSLKRMTEEQKIDTKMQFLSVIKRVIQNKDSI